MRILLLLLLFACSNVFGQKKAAGKPYVKLSPALVFIKDLDPAPYISGGIGGQIGRYTALGITGGYIKFEGASEAVIPLGIDLTLTDFKVKKVRPVVTIQTCYPIYAEYASVTTGGGGSSVHISTESKGRFMFNIGGGLAMPITKKKKFLLTGSYGQLMMKSTATVVSIIGARATSSTSTKNTQTEMVTVALTFML